MPRSKKSTRPSAKQGKERVVVLPVEQSAQLTKRVRPPKSLVRFFAESPLAHVTLDLSRDFDSGREINLFVA